MTNRQWLSTLTDEEFAKWYQTVGCGSCANTPEKGFCNNFGGVVSFDQNCCIDGTVKWLKKEYKEN